MKMRPRQRHVQRITGERKLDKARSNILDMPMVDIFPAAPARRQKKEGLAKKAGRNVPE